MFAEAAYPQPSTLHSLLVLAIGVGALYVSFWIHIVVHELGHWLAGRLMGFRIIEMHLGSGGLRWQGMIGAMRLRIEARPRGGFVRPYPTSSFRWLRLRYFFLTLGGPLASAGLILATLGLNASPLMQQEQLWIFIWLLILFTQSSLLFRSLWPREYQWLGRRWQNDGLLLWQILFTSKFSGNSEDRPLLTDETLAAHRQSLQDLLPWKSLYILEADSFATAVIFQTRTDLLEEAECVIRNAISFDPEVHTLRGTLGGVLFALGKKDEARPHLHALYEQSSVAIDRGITASYLAHYAHAEGDTAAALRYAQEAEAKYPDSPLLASMRTALSLSPQTEVSTQPAA